MVLKAKKLDLNFVKSVLRIYKSTLGGYPQRQYFSSWWALSNDKWFKIGSIVRKLFISFPKIGNAPTKIIIWHICWADDIQQTHTWKLYVYGWIWISTMYTILFTFVGNPWGCLETLETNFVPIFKNFLLFASTTK